MHSIRFPTRRTRLTVGAGMLVLAALLSGTPAAAQETPDEPAPTVAPVDAPSTAATPAPGEDSGATADLSEEYTIGANDVIEIRVFGLDEMTSTTRVQHNGTISLPLVGAVSLQGLSLDQAERKIAGMLAEKDLVLDPQVSLFVKEYVSRTIYVQGAVQKPGAYPMLGNQTVLDMIGQAGGLSGQENERAGRRIFVVRKYESGHQQTIEIDADQLVNQGDLSQNIFLRPGDLIMVPYEQKHRIYVSGAVKNPGPVEFPASQGITVLQAVTAAGGPNERGNLGKVQILRTRPDGTQERIVVNLKRIRRGKDEPFRLLNNDTVVVDEWFF